MISVRSQSLLAVLLTSCLAGVSSLARHPCSSLSCPQGEECRLLSPPGLCLLGCEARPVCTPVRPPDTRSQSFKNRRKKPSLDRDVQKKRNMKMNINFAEDAVRSRLDVVAPRLGVASVYETKPWTFLQQTGDEGLTYQAAMELLEQSQGVIVDHRGFSPRMDVGEGGGGAGGGRIQEKKGKKQLLSKQERPKFWTDFIRENLQRFRLF